MGFEKVDIKKVRSEDPESLFLDLRDRDPEIKHLWAHQADLLREYTLNHIKTRDVGLELPTGTGKFRISFIR